VPIASPEIENIAFDFAPVERAKLVFAKGHKMKVLPTSVIIAAAMMALCGGAPVHAGPAPVVSCTGPMHAAMIQKRQFDVVEDGARVCMIPWNGAGHDPLRGSCQEAGDGAAPCTVSGSYVRRGKAYVLGNDWTASDGTDNSVPSGK
jgi:hypothetical protein